MNLTLARDYLATVLDCKGAGFVIHKVNRNRDKEICLFYRRSGGKNRTPVGGPEWAGYEVLRLTLLMRWGRDGAEAENLAWQMMGSLMNQEFVFLGKLCFLQIAQDCPVWLGTDERGVYEYSLDFDFYYERG